MTLIAGFRSVGTPALVGDFRLGYRGDDAGLCKKTLIVADNFELTWTGSLDSAHKVVSILQEHTPQRGVTLELVQGVLTDPATVCGLKQGPVKIIGWVIDSLGEHCFLWQSQWPGRLYSNVPLRRGPDSCRRAGRSGCRR